MASEPVSIPSISTAGWTFDKVLEYSNNFHAVERVHVNAPHIDLDQVVKSFEETGLPIIIEGWHKRKDWPNDFTLDYFQEHSPQDIHVRNVRDWTDSQIPLAEFISASRAIPPHGPPGEQIRMYGKDADCPKGWSEWITTAGAIPEVLHWNGSNDYFRYRPKNARVETLMCYLGIGDTFTPAHKDLCASSGHNLMCYTENRGSSYWFMTKSSDAARASEFFQSLEQELDHEAHVISLDELAKAPFSIFVAEQTLGDLVLVPPRSCHQVVNFGGITLKTSWSRMTLDGLLTAYYHELPIYQRVCRAETYRVKNTIFCALRGQTKELEQLHPHRGIPQKGRPRVFSGKPNSKVSAMIDSLKALLLVFREIVAQEFSDTEHPCIDSTIGELNDEQTMEHRIVCDFCGGDIFQAFFECNTCLGAQEANGHADAYTICPACYVDGRSCKCMNLEPKQCFPHRELKRVVREADSILKDFDTSWSATVVNSDYSVFKAACQLLKQRSTTYTCAVDKQTTWGLSCKHCHNSRCFGHLLVQNRIHAVEAVSLHHSGQEKYHRAHQRGRNRYAVSSKAIQESQEAGSRGPIDMLRVHYTLKYHTCRPKAPEQSSHGFYDEWICGGYHEEDDATPTSTPSALATADPTPEPTNTLSSSSASTETRTVTQAKKRPARIVMDYVAVPEAPYAIHGMKGPPPRRKNLHSRWPPEPASNHQSPRHPRPTSESDGEWVPKRRERLSKPIRKSYPQRNHPSLIIGTRHPEDVAGPVTPSRDLSSPSGKQHRFSSGMVVTLADGQGSPLAPAHPHDGPPSSHLLSTSESLAMSLADVMNQANAHNSTTATSSPARKRKRAAEPAAERKRRTQKAALSEPIESSWAPTASCTPGHPAATQARQVIIKELVRQIKAGESNFASFEEFLQAIHSLEEKRDPAVTKASEAAVQSVLGNVLTAQEVRAGFAAIAQQTLGLSKPAQQGRDPEGSNGRVKDPATLTPLEAASAGTARTATYRADTPPKPSTSTRAGHGFASHTPLLPSYESPPLPRRRVQSQVRSKLPAHPNIEASSSASPRPPPPLPAKPKAPWRPPTNKGGGKGKERPTGAQRPRSSEFVNVSPGARERLSQKLKTEVMRMRPANGEHGSSSDSREDAAVSESVPSRFSSISASVSWIQEISPTGEGSANALSDSHWETPNPLKGAPESPKFQFISTSQFDSPLSHPQEYDPWIPLLAPTQPH